jgi:hypothetical protein
VFHIILLLYIYIYILNIALALIISVSLLKSVNKKSKKMEQVYLNIYIKVILSKLYNYTLDRKGRIYDFLK